MNDFPSQKSTVVHRIHSPFHFSLNGLFISALFVLPSIVELFILHAFVVARFGPNNTAFGMYGRDVLFPLFLGIFLYVCHLQREMGLAPRFFLGPVLLNFFLLVCALAIFAAQAEFATPSETGWAMALFFLFGLGALASSYFLFLAPRTWLEATRELGSKIIYPSLGLILLVGYPIFLKWAWIPMAQFTAQIVSVLLHAFGVTTRVSATSQILLRHPKMSANIAIACSGLEGIFFFSFFLLLIRTFEKPARGMRFEISWFVAGIFAMFLLNALRIASFFLIGLYLVEHDYGTGYQFVGWAFHSNVGWIGYFVGLVVLFQLRHWMRLRQAV